MDQPVCDLFCCITAYPRALSWGQFCFYCIQLTLSVSSSGTGCASIYMLTKPKYKASAHQASQMISRASCLLVSKTLPNGWAPTDYSWTQPRLRSCGAAHSVASINCQVSHFSSVAAPLVHHPSFKTWAYGIRIDNGLTMSTHITKVVASCFALLWQLHSVRQSLSRESFTLLVVILMLVWLDYCNGVLAGLPASQLRQLQSVLHAAAQLIHGICWHDHATLLLQQLHWLSMPERVTFKLCIMVYRCLHGLGTEYFSEDFRLVSEIHSHQQLHSASSTDVVIPATCRSSLGDHAFLVAGARAWNALPPSVTSAPSLSSFQWLLKTFLFQQQLHQ